MKKALILVIALFFTLTVSDLSFAQPAPAAKPETPAVKAEEKAQIQGEVKKEKKAKKKAKKKTSKKKGAKKKQAAQQQQS